jgi:protein-ribulosamine 3-kinase
VNLPVGLVHALREPLAALGEPGEITHVTPLGGGCIDVVVRLETPRHAYLLKWSAHPRADQFAYEAEGLRLLQAAGSVAVPVVFAWRDEANADQPAYLLEEFLAAGPTRPAWEPSRLGAELAGLHRYGGEAAGRFGLGHDNYIGATRQPNGWSQDWLAFFREQRLGFQVRLAREAGRLNRAQAHQLDALLEHLERWLGGHACQPSLLHGDLWAGNVIAGPGGRAYLIDPAVYFGDREVDLAFSELFGGFPAAFYRAYRENWPLEPGYETRRDIYNLYHLLNHLNLFGQGYAAPIDAILRYYVS